MTDDCAVIFDMDGLLVDTEVVWEKVEVALLATHGATYIHEIARLHMGMRLEEAVAVMVREYGLTMDPGIFGTELVDALLAELAHEVRPMPGAEALMAQAAAWGGPVAIASGSPMRVVQHVVAHFGWGELLTTICSGDEVARGKPAPDIFLLAAQRLGVEPTRCLVLEDSLNGARAAHAAGMRCIAVPNPAYEPSAFVGIADPILPTLEGLRLTDWLPTPTKP